MVSLVDFTFHPKETIFLPRSLAEHDMPCLSKQCRSISVGASDLDLHCLSFNMWIYSNNPDQVI